MDALKRALYVQAALWAFVGLALALVPKFALVTVFAQPPFYDYSWLRLLGLQTFGLALFMVLVGHRIDDLWWWAWAFELINVAVVVVVVVNTVLGRGPGEPAVLWWLFSVAALAESFSLLYGLFVASRQQPLP
jgi:hypothetical protein